MANGYGPIALAGYVQQQGELGRHRGQQNRLAQLASQAYGAPAQERRGLVQQAIQTDPAAGFALGQSLEQDRGQQMGQLSQKARMLVGYAKAGNQQGVQALYPQLAAEAQQLGLGQGIPQQWDESFLPGIEQLAMMGSGNAGNTVHSQRVGDDGFIYNTMRDGTLVNTGVRADRQMWFRDHPGMAPHLVGKGGEVLPVGGQAQGAPAGGPGMVTFTGPDGMPVRIGDDVPEHVRQSILANPQGWNDAPDGASAALPPAQGAQVAQAAPAAPNLITGVPVRPSEGQVAAEQERARQQAQLDYMPARASIETQAAVDRERAVGQVKADQEREAGRPKARLAMEQAKSRVERVDDLVDSILPRVGYWTSGLMSLSGIVPGTPAGDLKRDLGTLQAIAGFDELNAMRASSPTGGALGNVTERELAFLQSVVRNIENSQSPEQLRRNLAAFRNEVKGSWDRIERAYEEDYGQGSQGGQPSQRLRFNPETGRIE